MLQTKSMDKMILDSSVRKFSNINRRLGKKKKKRRLNVSNKMSNAPARLHEGTRIRFQSCMRNYIKPKNQGDNTHRQQCVDQLTADANHNELKVQ